MPLSKNGETIGFIGGGNLAEAITGSFIRKGGLPPERILVSDPRASRRRELEEAFGIETSGDNTQVVRDARVIFLTIKPQVVKRVLDEIREAITPDHLVISPCAGIPTTRIESFFADGIPVVRIMPNIAALVGESATGLAVGSRVDRETRDRAVTLCEAFGMVEEIDEDLMDAVTGLSGSGPAYMFLVIDALADAGVKVGLRRDQARRLVAQTLMGSSRLLLDSGSHPGELKDRVTSPGGTAITGLAALEEGGLRTTLIKGVEEASRRSAELGCLLNGGEKTTNDPAFSPGFVMKRR